MQYIERNTVWGFNDRVLKNLKFVDAARRAGSTEVHVVTQLITSLLGLIVFPYAEILEKGDTTFQSYTLPDLSTKGWPTWTFTIGSSPNLDQHVRHLRNAISHRGLWFDSDDRELHSVGVRFSDRPHTPKGAPYNWQATIKADDLQVFVLKLAALLKAKECDNS